MHYDYLIVGAGLFGATFAQRVTEAGKSCLIIDRRNHIAGNAYTDKWKGIDVHCYGAHIFHTGNKAVWDYVNRFAEFNNFINSPMAVYKDEIYNLPFNMNTFSKMWGIKTPKEAMEIINSQIDKLGIKMPKNLEEQALSLVGTDVYQKLIKGYTYKQWGRPCNELPSFIIKRIPLRFTYDNNYFTDRYQGIPVDGYTAMAERMLAGIDVRLNTEYREFAVDSEDTWDRVIYTGMIDEYFDYSLGELQYRSLRFETEYLEGVEDYQGNAVINYTDEAVPYTRIIEHKHFVFGDMPDTVITREYPQGWVKGQEPFYPINDEDNDNLYSRYKELASGEDGVLFAGRLGSYRYMDMDRVIEGALSLADALV